MRWFRTQNSVRLKTSRQLLHQQRRYYAILHKFHCRNIAEPIKLQLTNYLAYIEAKHDPPIIFLGKVSELCTSRNARWPWTDQCDIYSESRKLYVTRKMLHNFSGKLSTGCIPVQKKFTHSKFTHSEFWVEPFTQNSFTPFFWMTHSLLFTHFLHIHHSLNEFIHSPHVLSMERKVKEWKTWSFMLYSAGVKKYSLTLHSLRLGAASSSLTTHSLSELFLHSLFISPSWSECEQVWLGAVNLWDSGLTASLYERMGHM